jgi:hypothetical protein
VREEQRGRQEADRAEPDVVVVRQDVGGRAEVRDVVSGGRAEGYPGGDRSSHMQVQPPSTARLMPLTAWFSSRKRDAPRSPASLPDGRSASDRRAPAGARRHVAPLRAVADDGRVERVHRVGASSITSVRTRLVTPPLTVVTVVEPG